MLLNALKNNEVDKCVYVKNIDKHLMLCLYMDNMFILVNNDYTDYTIKFNKKIFTNKFNIKDLGVADVILKIKITDI